MWLGADWEPTVVERPPKTHLWVYEFKEVQELRQRGKGWGKLEGCWEMLWCFQRSTVFVWNPVPILGKVPINAAFALAHGVTAFGCNLQGSCCFTLKVQLAIKLVAGELTATRGCISQ